MGLDLKACLTEKHNGLHLAAAYSKIAEFDYLLSEALAHDMADCGYTFVHAAIHSGRVEMLKHMVELGLSPRETKHGIQEAHYAAKMGQVEILKYLKSAGTDLGDKWGADYWTPLHFAVSEGQREAAEYLVSIGLDPRKDAWVFGESPFDLAKKSLPELAEAWRRK